MIGHPPEHVEALPVIAEWSVVVQVGTRRAAPARTARLARSGAGLHGAHVRAWQLRRGALGPHEKLREFGA